MPNGASNRDAMLKDLELQWQDHFHMRDQTWKALHNAALLFVGVIADFVSRQCGTCHGLVAAPGLP